MSEQKKEENLYEEYGKLLIQQEVIQAKIVNVKKKIIASLNAPKIPLASNPEKTSVPSEGEPSG